MSALENSGKLLNLIKNKILGESYALSVAFVSSAKMRKINQTYRNLDKNTNILSFAFSKKEGEILLNRPKIKKEAEQAGLTYKKLLGQLFIHGCLHLEGMEHSSRMESKEKKWQKIFQLE